MEQREKTAELLRLRKLAFKSAQIKYGQRLPLAVRRRVCSELKIINKNDAALYYVTAAEISRRLRDAGILFYLDGEFTSSLIAYLTGITQIDPLPPYYNCPSCGRLSFVGREEGQWPALDMYAVKRCHVCEALSHGSGFDIDESLLDNGVRNSLSAMKLCVAENYIREAFMITKDIWTGMPWNVYISEDLILSKLTRLEMRTKVGVKDLWPDYKDLRAQVKAVGPLNFYYETEAFHCLLEEEWPDDFGDFAKMFRQYTGGSAEGPVTSLWFEKTLNFIRLVWYRINYPRERGLYFEGRCCYYI